MRNRFFNEHRIDSALQRSYLANVVRFYFERSRRYNLFDPTAEAPFIEQLTRLEKAGLEFRPAYAGYVVSLDGIQRKPLFIDTQTERAKIVVLTARDLEQATEFSPLLVWPPTNNSSDPIGVDVEREMSTLTKGEQAVRSEDARECIGDSYRFCQRIPMEEQAASAQAK
jgi:DNA phosphorothioation-dependent restriction protein DptH